MEREQRRRRKRRGKVGVKAEGEGAGKGRGREARGIRGGCSSAERVPSEGNFPDSDLPKLCSSKLNRLGIGRRD